MKTLIAIVTFFLSLLPLAGIILIAILMYYEVKTPYNFLVILMLLVIGVVLSRSVFNMMSRQSIIGLFTANSATPSMDNLEPNPGSEVRKLNPIELMELFDAGKLDFKRGTVSIWGHKKGIGLNSLHQIQTIEFKEEKEMLFFQFEDHSLLVVRKPSFILCASTYLKIIKAQEIFWQVPSQLNSTNHYSYLNTGTEILTKSNTSWKPKMYELGIGMNALYMQG